MLRSTHVSIPGNRCTMRNLAKLTFCDFGKGTGSVLQVDICNQHMMSPHLYYSKFEKFEGTELIRGALGGLINLKKPITITELAPNNVVDLIYSVSVSYRQSAVFLMNPETERLMSKWIDEDGRPYLTHRNNVFQKNRLLGYQVWVDQAMPDNMICFGSISEGVEIEGWDVPIIKPLSDTHSCMARCVRQSLIDEEAFNLMQFGD